MYCECHDLCREVFYLGEDYPFFMGKGEQELVNNAPITDFMVYFLCKLLGKSISKGKQSQLLTVIEALHHLGFLLAKNLIMHSYEFYCIPIY